jgi:1-acyl-sn-glycerol-3-phosphate acyltransferase
MSEQVLASSSGGMGFAAVRGLIRLLLRVFYRRIEVVGAERIPAHGGLIVAANHPNSIVDAMILLAVVPRRLRTLAKAQLFQHPLVGPFLRVLGALPVNRRQEAGDDPRKNDALFAETTRTLREGGGIVIFPEGRTQPEPVLLELRTGAARMLLAALPAQATLLPAGLVFRKPGIFREGDALVFFGEPISAEECLARASSDPELAARELTERLTHALRELIIEAEDLETLGVLEMAEDIWSAGGQHRRGPDRVRWLRWAAERYRDLARREPERLADYVGRLQRFIAELEAAGLSPRSLTAPRAGAAAVRFALRQAFMLLVGTPLALCGFLIHGLPYTLVGVAVRLIPHTAEEDATDQIVAGVVLYPLFWFLEGWLVRHFGGGVALAAFAILLAPSGFVALAWRARLAHAARETRVLARILREPGLLARLRDEQARLFEELKALAGKNKGEPA